MVTAPEAEPPEEEDFDELLQAASASVALSPRTAAAARRCFMGMPFTEGGVSPDREGDGAPNFPECGHRRPAGSVWSRPEGGPVYTSYQTVTFGRSLCDRLVKGGADPLSRSTVEIHRAVTVWRRIAASMPTARRPAVEPSAAPCRSAGQMTSVS